jgi:hypothetical protein
MYVENEWPRAHCVVDDFFPASALSVIFREIASLDRKLAPGLVRDIGHDGQSVFFEHERRKNRAVWIHDPSRTLRLFREQLWSEELVNAFEQAREPLFQIIPECSAPHLQLSKYMTGDHYDFHEDEGAGVNLTTIVFLAASPAKVSGGDLVIAYDGEETTIPFRHNRLVIFPSKTLHRVTPVRIRGTDLRDARISLQCWLTHGRTERTTKRPPTVDRPTFLLAEEPIVAAAQAMVGTSDQSPEDLYWGAFYLSRILSSNLRALAGGEIELGPVSIRHGDELEVHASGRYGKTTVRVGFRLRSAETPAAEALVLFAESSRARHEQRLPPLATEARSRTILKRLLARC